MEVRICHLYPDLMNMYGDRGNVIALCRRALWLGLDVRLVTAGIGEDMDFGGVDLVFLGGGQDREQKLISHDLHETKGPALKAAVLDGLVVLAICGGYQLLGRYYRTAGGEILPGVGIFDAHTDAGPRRMIGNVVLETELTGAYRSLVGFENHAGKTYLGPGARPLGKVLVGDGNNGEDGLEGAVYLNAVGTYLHGSLLPKNPWLTDFLIGRALSRRYGAVSLPALDDSLEEQAHRAAIRRAIQTRNGMPAAVPGLTSSAVRKTEG